MQVFMAKDKNNKPKEYIKYTSKFFSENLGNFFIRFINFDFGSHNPTDILLNFYFKSYKFKDKESLHNHFKNVHKDFSDIFKFIYDPISEFKDISLNPSQKLKLLTISSNNFYNITEYSDSSSLEHYNHLVNTVSNTLIESVQTANSNLKECAEYFQNNTNLLTEIQTLTLYNIKNPFEIGKLLYLFLYEIVNSNLQLKICEHCGKYFFPENKSDEKYCNNELSYKKIVKDSDGIKKNKIIISTCKKMGANERKKHRLSIDPEYKKYVQTYNKIFQKFTTLIKNKEPNSKKLKREWKEAVKELTLLRDNNIISAKERIDGVESFTSASVYIAKYRKKINELNKTLRKEKRSNKEAGKNGNNKKR